MAYNLPTVKPQSSYVQPAAVTRDSVKQPVHLADRNVPTELPYQSTQSNRRSAIRTANQQQAHTSVSTTANQQRAHRPVRQQQLPANQNADNYIRNLWNAKCTDNDAVDSTWSGTSTSAQHQYNTSTQSRLNQPANDTPRHTKRAAPAPPQVQRSRAYIHNDVIMSSTDNRHLQGTHDEDKTSTCCRCTIM